MIAGEKIVFPRLQNSAKILASFVLQRGAGVYFPAFPMCITETSLPVMRGTKLDCRAQNLSHALAFLTAWKPPDLSTGSVKNQESAFIPFGFHRVDILQ